MKAVRRGFSLLEKGFMGYGLGAQVEYSELYWTLNSSELSQRIAEELQDFYGDFRIFLLSPNYFAYLPGWTVSGVTFTRAATIIAPEPKLFVEPRIRYANNDSFGQSSNNLTSDRPLIVPGFDFRVLTDYPDEEPPATQDLASDLMIYIPVGLCSLILVVGVLITAAYSR